jgi:hypothetical protein
MCIRHQVGARARARCLRFPALAASERSQHDAPATTCTHLAAATGAVHGCGGWGRLLRRAAERVWVRDLRAADLACAAERPVEARRRPPCNLWGAYRGARPPYLPRVVRVSFDATRSPVSGARAMGRSAGKRLREPILYPRRGCLRRRPTTGRLARTRGSCEKAPRRRYAGSRAGRSVVFDERSDLWHGPERVQLVLPQRNIEGEPPPEAVCSWASCSRAPRAPPRAGTSLVRVLAPTYLT